VRWIVPERRPTWISTGHFPPASARGLNTRLLMWPHQELGVEAMSLYHHVPNKDAILDGVVDAVFAAIELPPVAADWRAAIRARAGSARVVLARHSWALGLMDSRRNPGPATLRHHDAVLGVLREAGFSVAMATHAVSLLDSYIAGFVLQESSLPMATPADVADVAGGILASLPAGECRTSGR
jgi:AcrR family transcriptional regulator